MVRRLLTFWFVLLLLLAMPGSVLAQEYFFGVPQEVVNVYINEDGTYSLDYVWTFANQPGAHAIEYVDVGMPNGSFDMNNVRADVNGVPVSVSQSDYQSSGSGFAVVLGSQTIPAGETGTVHVRADGISRVLYPDTQASDYASADFAPTYFGSQYVTGNTDLTVTFHLPPGVQPTQPRYHIPEGWVGADAPVSGIDGDGRVTYTWESSAADASSVYTFGASFPSSLVPAAAIVRTSALDTLFSGIANFVNGFVSNLPSFIFCGCMILFFVILPISSSIQGRRRKLQYIPPKIGIEGHGIKRGLTAVEAAILMEEPLDKVLTMMLFGVVKKGAATVVSKDPLKIQATDPAPDGLYDYESSFLAAMKDDAPRTRQAGLETMMVALVKSVSEKMRGFSRRETVDYYKGIMERAWQQVEQANTPEVKSQAIDENLEWTMLDRNYDTRARNVFTGPIFVPMWWGAYDPGFRAAPAATAGPSIPTSSRGSSGALPGSAFAASVVTGVQNFSRGVLGGNVNSFTSKVTSKTNPVPVASRSGGSYHGGGGGCACACACAGCACACAGGGR
jgi:hypothetical protein